MIEKDEKRPKVLIQGAENFGRGGDLLLLGI